MLESAVLLRFSCFWQGDVYQVEYDGASKKNPGPAGAGALVRRPDGSVVRSFFRRDIDVPGYSWVVGLSSFVRISNPLCQFGVFYEVTVAAGQGTELSMNLCWTQTSRVPE